MPIICDIHLSLKTREVLRRQGLGRGAKVRPEIKLLIRELLASLRKARLLEPAVAHEYYTVSSMNGNQISLNGGKATNGPSIPVIFPEAKELVVLRFTIGPKLEKQVTAHTKSDEALRGMILDGIGSTAENILAVEFLRRLGSEFWSQGNSPL
ncbi:MAG: hypothetical protein ACOC6O_00240 [Chloroflexota bacterium]